MATLTTKYSVGDSVFHAGTLSVRKQHPCPDCKGQKKWKAISPAGGEYEFGCPRCSTRYMNDRDLSLDYFAFEASVSKLTIGSIQVNTAEGSWDKGNRYMCRETGVGSGTVYNEIDLYRTEEEALEAGRVKASLANSETKWVVQQFNKSLELSDYQIEHAMVKLAKDEESKARSLLWNIGDLFSRIEEADDKEAILEAVSDYKNYDWSRDKEKIDQTEPAKPDEAFA